MSVSASDVLKLIDDWHPRSCKTEKDFERSLHKHLERNLPSSEIIMQYASGRVKGDIGIDGEILIEIKDGLKSTGQLQRLMGQLDLYNGLWKGRVIVLVCGDSQRDLVNTLTKKVESFRSDFLTELFEERKIHLVIRGAGKPKESSWW